MKGPCQKCGAEGDTVYPFNVDIPGWIDCKKCGHMTPLPRDNQPLLPGIRCLRAKLKYSKVEVSQNGEILLYQNEE